MIARLLCRLFGHRWVPHHSNDPRASVKVCRRCFEEPPIPGPRGYRYAFKEYRVDENKPIGAFRPKTTVPYQPFEDRARMTGGIDDHTWVKRPCPRCGVPCEVRIHEPDGWRCGECAYKELEAEEAKTPKVDPLVLVLSEIFGGHLEILHRDTGQYFGSEIWEIVVRLRPSVFPHVRIPGYFDCHVFRQRYDRGDPHVARLALIRLFEDIAKTACLEAERASAGTPPP